MCSYSIEAIQRDKKISTTPLAKINSPANPTLEKNTEYHPDTGIVSSKPIKNEPTKVITIRYYTEDDCESYKKYKAPMHQNY